MRWDVATRRPTSGPCSIAGLGLAADDAESLGEVEALGERAIAIGNRTGQCAAQRGIRLIKTSATNRTNVANESKMQDEAAGHIAGEELKMIGARTCRGRNGRQALGQDGADRSFSEIFA
jgi:hypothetical protein